MYDYAAGKADWRARGLPREGEKAGERLAVDFARDDVVTCRLKDRMGEVRERVRESPYRFAFVVSAGGLVLGRLRRAALEGDPGATAEQVMEPGPTTVRADTAPAELLERLTAKDLHTAVLTNPEGVLLGIVRRADLEGAGVAAGRAHGA